MRFLLYCLLVALYVPLAASAQVTRLTAPDVTEVRGFGRATDIDGAYLVAGAPDGEGSGMAYIHSRPPEGRWQHQAILAVDGLEPGDEYGHAVAIEGDYLVVGSPGADSDTGAAYVFYNDPAWGWTLQDTLSDPSAVRFGQAIAFDAGRIAVGAPDSLSGGTGRVYVFTLDQQTEAWTGSEVPVPDGVEPGDAFGFAVDLDEATLLVGAPYTPGETFGGAAGTVYAFAGGEPGDSWTLDGELAFSDSTLNDQNANARFGHAVALDGDRALIGAPQTFSHHILSGSSYVYARDNGLWTQQTILTPDEPDLIDLFGYAVDLDGDEALVGAPSGPAGGTALLFHVEEDGTFTQSTLFSGSDEGTPAYGTSVTIHSDDIVIGAPHERGTTYHYERSNASWTLEFAFSSGRVVGGSGFGSFVVASDTLLLTGAREARSDGAAYLYAFDVAEGWVPRAVFTDKDETGPRPFFGHAGAFDADHVLIGAPNADAPLVDNGAAYLFTRDPDTDTWDRTARWVPDTPVAYQGFGYAVAMEGDYAFVGAPGAVFSYGDDVPPGSVHLYVNDPMEGWSEHAVLYPPDPLIGDRFGASLAVDDSVLIVGQPSCDAMACPAGAVYVFVRESETGTWMQQARLTGSNTSARRFGTSVALDGDLLAVGAPGTPVGPAETYVFVRSGDEWIEQARLPVSEPIIRGSQFGYAVAVDSALVAVGAPVPEAVIPEDDYDGFVVVYQREDTSWNQVETRSMTNVAFGTSLALVGERLFVGAPWAGAVHVYEQATAIPIEARPEAPAGGVALAPNYPNPFSETTVLAFEVAAGREGTVPVRLSVYDVLGREVAVLVDRPMAPGRHEVRWEAAGRPAGVYFYRLDRGGHSQTRSMILVR